MGGDGTGDSRVEPLLFIPGTSPLSEWPYCTSRGRWTAPRPRVTFVRVNAPRPNARVKRLRPAPPPSRALGLPAAVVSVALHVALVALALAPPFTTTGSDHAGADESAQLLYPLLRPQPRPVEEHVSYVGLGGDAAIEVPVGRKDESPSRLPAEMPAEAPAPVPVPEEAPHTYSEIEVDSAAIRDPSSVGPVYPQKLLEAHVEGGTLVRFVVD